MQPRMPVFHLAGLDPFRTALKECCLPSGRVDPMASPTSFQRPDVHGEQAGCWSDSVATPQEESSGEDGPLSLVIFLDLLRRKAAAF